MNKQRIIDLYAFIDWLMKFPEELNHQLWCDIETLERNKNMPYVTSVERFGIEKGLKQGIELGLEQGLEQGLKKGVQKGEANVVIRLLTKRFGPLSLIMLDRLNQATIEQLELWADRVLEAKTLESVLGDH
jgi:flagellar biosynthesis/type III secretory pathway protein FliH